MEKTAGLTSMAKGLFTSQSTKKVVPERIDKGRRMALLGAGAAAVKVLPSDVITRAAKGSGNMVGDALSLVTPPSGLASLATKVTTATEIPLKIAQLRAYRMAVKDGVPKKVAMASLCSWKS